MSIIINKIRDFGIAFEENKLFQTDLFSKPTKADLSLKYQSVIIDGINVLNRLTPKRESENLQNFAKRFSERYETRELPLLEVLDSEIGIGYLSGGNVGVSPLIDEIILPQNKQDQTTTWTQTEKWLFEKLKKANEERLFEIEITDEDLKDFPEADWSDLPPSFSLMFRIVEDEKVYFESCGGSSAINLLGRFAEGNEEVLRVSKEISKSEKAHNQGVIFSEIVHLPESRTGNILLHPAFRDYEIPFLGKSSLPIENQIPLQDLYISVRENEIILRSKSLNKIIIPRLSNAHNYSFNALPVYQFLCDLQHQGKRTTFGFNWGSMANHFEFLPRITYKNVILEPATWNISDLESFFKKFRADSSLFVLADGDNELLIDFENLLSVAAFKDAVKNRKSFQLKEFFYQKENSIVKNADNQRFTNQFIALLVKQEASYQEKKSEFKPIKIQREFSVGSEWLYFKLYGGVKVADSILTEYIKPLVDNFFTKNLIDYWFFIRYSDPDNHLRVRFHLRDTSKIGEVISHFYDVIKPAVNAKYLWKIQIDTYTRELERYGFENIVLAEKLFFHQSESCIRFLELTEGDERENIRWLWGMRVVDELLNDFEMNLIQKLELMRNLKEGFGREFGMNITLKQQLDKKYRENRPQIQIFMNIDEADEIYGLLIQILQEKSNYLKTISQEIIKNINSESLPNLLGSYIHMTLNRLIPSNQRLHEMVIYDFLFRFYTSCNAQK